MENFLLGKLIKTQKVTPKVKQQKNKKYQSDYGIENRFICNLMDEFNMSANTRFD